MHIRVKIFGERERFISQDLFYSLPFEKEQRLLQSWLSKKGLISCCCQKNEIPMHIHKNPNTNHLHLHTNPNHSMCHHTSCKHNNINRAKSENSSQLKTIRSIEVSSGLSDFRVIIQQWYYKSWMHVFESLRRLPQETHVLSYMIKLSKQVKMGGSVLYTNAFFPNDKFDVIKTINRNIILLGLTLPETIEYHESTVSFILQAFGSAKWKVICNQEDWKQVLHICPLASIEKCFVAARVKVNAESFQCLEIPEFFGMTNKHMVLVQNEYESALSHELITKHRTFYRPLYPLEEKCGFIPSFVLMDGKKDTLIEIWYESNMNQRDQKVAYYRANKIPLVEWNVYQGEKMPIIYKRNPKKG